MIRLATEKDLPAICEVRRQVHELHVKGRPDIFQMPTTEQIAAFDASVTELLKDESFYLLVCEIKGAIVGYSVVRLVTRKAGFLRPDSFYYFIDEFGVEASHRGMGYGTALMQDIIARAKAEHASAVNLDVWGFNESAEQFYRKLGMKTKQTFLELQL